MSPLGREAYSREVKALPPSSHTGCALSAKIGWRWERWRSRRLLPPSEDFCGPRRSFSGVAFFFPPGPRWPRRSAACGAAVDERSRTDAPLSFSPPSPPSRLDRRSFRGENMKKQFNRMRQLASQNLGRSVFSFSPALACRLLSCFHAVAFGTLLPPYL